MFFFFFLCLGSQPSQKETRNDDPSLEEVSSYSIFMPRGLRKSERKNNRRARIFFSRFRTPDIRLLIALLLSCRSICQMLVNISVVEFQRAVSKFRKRKIKWLSCAHVLHKT